jgi:hypothetical protein
VALTEVYVDPSIAADSGTGTIGDPYGDLEYAIEQTTFDTTNGTRFNVKAGITEVLAANLFTATQDVVTTPAYVPSISAPLIFQGYAAVAGDGGMGSISGGGLVPVWDDGTTLSYVHFRDLECFNVGANIIIQLNDFSSVQYCKCHGSSGTYGIQIDNYSSVIGCYVYDCTGSSSIYADGGEVLYNYVVNSESASHTTVYGYTSASIRHNIVVLEGAGTNGIIVINGAEADNNTVYAEVASTGSGVLASQSTHRCKITNNLVEGFSGVGGDGVWSTNLVDLIHGNAVYNCTNPYEFSGAQAEINYLDDNEILTASPFNDAANGDFSPADVGNVLEGALPQIIGLP